MEQKWDNATTISLGSRFDAAMKQQYGQTKSLEIILERANEQAVKSNSYLGAVCQEQGDDSRTIHLLEREYEDVLESTGYESEQAGQLAWQLENIYRRDKQFARLAALRLDNYRYHSSKYGPLDVRTLTLQDSALSALSLAGNYRRARAFGEELLQTLSTTGLSGLLLYAVKHKMAVIYIKSAECQEDLERAAMLQAETIQDKIQFGKEEENGLDEREIRKARIRSVRDVHVRLKNWLKVIDLSRLLLGSGSNVRDGRTHRREIRLSLKDRQHLVQALWHSGRKRESFEEELKRCKGCVVTEGYHSQETVRAGRELYTIMRTIDVSEEEHRKVFSFLWNIQMARGGISPEKRENDGLANFFQEMRISNGALTKRSEVAKQIRKRKQQSLRRQKHSENDGVSQHLSSAAAGPSIPSRNHIPISSILNHDPGAVKAVTGTDLREYGTAGRLDLSNYDSECTMKPLDDGVPSSESLTHLESEHKGEDARLPSEQLSAEIYL